MARQVRRCRPAGQRVPASHYAAALQPDRTGTPMPMNLGLTKEQEAGAFEGPK